MVAHNIKPGMVLFFLRDGAWVKGEVEEVLTLRNYMAKTDEIWISILPDRSERTTLIEPSRLFKAPRRALGETRS